MEPASILSLPKRHVSCLTAIKQVFNSSRTPKAATENRGLSMNPSVAGTHRKPPPGGGMFALLTPYRPLIATLAGLTIAGNALNLVVPKLISHAIDAYTQQTFVLSTTVL